MRKVHLLFKKEEIDLEKIQGKTVVVFDLLLATSTITAVLHAGAKEVIPVSSKEEAEIEATRRDRDSYLLVGEYQGRAIKHFHEPNPLKLKEVVNDKTVILTTTNGSVAINRSSMAERVYIGSLLNESAVANDLFKTIGDETIVLICSGSSGVFCIEDYYGAGSFIAALMQENADAFTLSEGAFAAYEFYKNRDAKQVLQASLVGQKLTDSGFGDEVSFVAKRNLMPVVPRLVNRKNICLTDETEDIKKRRL